MCLSGIAEGKKRETGTKEIFEVIIAMTSQNYDRHQTRSKNFKE